MCWQFQLGEVCNRSILHARSEPEVLPQPICGLPSRHLRGDPVAYVKDPATRIGFPSERPEVLTERAFWDGWVGVGGGSCRGEEEAEEEDESFHGDCKSGAE